MLRFLDYLYYCTISRNFILRIIKYSIRVLSNLYVRYLMPIKQRNNICNSDTIIVSLTSFPDRINNVWMTIATLLNQEMENIKVILWLSKEQFESINILPQSLLKLQEKGLEIFLVDDDLRPHKKYYYAFKKYPNNIVVTVDDDILYHPHLIKALQIQHKSHPTCVICNRGIIIQNLPYEKWRPNTIYNEERLDILPTGIGGVLYPPYCYDSEHIFDIKTIKKTCLHGDDLWLSFMTRKMKTKIIQTNLKTGLITILFSQEVALCNTNIGQNRNDRQIKAISDWANNKFHYNFYLK